jgi:hypothetical protein
LQAQEKPLKRLNYFPHSPTRLKPGVNEKSIIAALGFRVSSVAEIIRVHPCPSVVK